MRICAMRLSRDCTSLTRAFSHAGTAAWTRAKILDKGRLGQRDNKHGSRLFWHGSGSRGQEIFKSTPPALHSTLHWKN